MKSTEKHLVGNNLKKHLEELKKNMMDFADDLNFEEAAKLRDEIKRLENNELELPSNSNIVYKKNKRKKESTLLNVYRFLHTVNRIISSLYSADKMIKS